jgi:N12 class adenine-specific DNA methylase
MAQAALNDPDAIIVTHSSFGKLGVNATRTRREIVNDMVAELEDALEGRQGRGARRTPEAAQARTADRADEAPHRRQDAAKDQTLTFEDMGVDFLYVDEAHEFRKLDFATNRQAKGIDSGGSAKALDLYVKSRWLEKQNPRRNLVLASGTPSRTPWPSCSRSCATWTRRALERDGISSFDAWANMFGEVACRLRAERGGRL